ncbi:peptidyl-prolyl cis-trans isomerase, partial [Vibrio parahaemolyticus]
KTVFAQASGEVSPILDDKNGNYSVVRTDSITPSAPKPFDQVKKDVLTAWKAQEQAKAAQAEADKIAQGLRDGKDARDFGKQAGVTIRTSDG